MEKQKKPFAVGLTDVLLLAVAVLFLVGMLTLFRACAAKDDGSYMTCHWANQAETGIAAAFVGMALLHLFVRDAKQKQGIDLAILPLCVVAAILPKNLISLCMMNTMRCHTHMLPAAIVFSILLAAVALWDWFAQRKRAA